MVGSGGILRVQETLYAGQELFSPSRKFKLEMQTDNNLVVYDLRNGGRKPLWAANTWDPNNAGQSQAILQGDGNFVVYKSGKATWASNTWQKPSDRLAMQDDGNLVIYDRGTAALWASNTWQADWQNGSGGGVVGGGTSNNSGPQQQVLDQVNQLRAKHHAPPVSWDNTVASFSQNWANHLISTGKFEHSGGQYGECIWSGSGGSWKLQDAVDSWYGEVAQYDYNSPGFGMETGHFTALVWASTQRIGCASASANGRMVVVMNFDPPGNMGGQFPNNVRAP